MPARRSAPTRRASATPLRLAATLLAASVLAGCAAGPGAQPAAIAPQLFINAQGLKQWDRPEAFGPVPAELLATGRAHCATFNNGGKRYVPAGYHPHARSVEGFPFEDGGFFCVRE
jgi:hypothetical protein